MIRRSLGVCILIAAVTTGVTTASNSGDVVPRFLLDATTAAADDEVALRVARTPRLPQREIRLYLVPTGVAASVRTRFDSRLSFIGSVRASRHARLVFTVPALEAGRYALAYWCRGCLPRGKSLGVQASPKLRVTAPAGEGCQTTRPNGNRPSGAPPAWTGWNHHGNGQLSVLLRSDGTVVTNPLGGYKMRWLASPGVSGPLTVWYRLLDPPSAPLTARTGTLNGSDSTMSQMSFEPGCWQITGRLDDVSLSFVVQVMLGNA